MKEEHQIVLKTLPLPKRCDLSAETPVEDKNVILRPFYVRGCVMTREELYGLIGLPTGVVEQLKQYEKQRKGDVPTEIKGQRILCPFSRGEAYSASAMTRQGRGVKPSARDSSFDPGRSQKGILKNMDIFLKYH